MAPQPSRPGDGLILELAIKEKGAATGDEPGPPKSGVVGAARLVGRQEDLSALLQAAINPPSLTLIEGEPGIGKSRLVKELVSHRSLKARRVIVGFAHPSREPFFLGPIVEALGGLPTSGAPAVRLPNEAAAVLTLLPDLSDLLQDSSGFPEQESISLLLKG